MAFTKRSSAEDTFKAAVKAHRKAELDRRAHKGIDQPDILKVSKPLKGSVVGTVAPLKAE